MRRDRMFAKLQRQINANSHLIEEARRDAALRVEREEARLAEPLTRREVLDVVNTLAAEYASMNDPEWNRIANAFYALAGALS